MNIIKHNKTFLSILACVFLLCCAISITLMYSRNNVLAADDRYKKETDATNVNVSFAVMAEAATDYMNMVAGEQLPRDKNLTAIHTGTAGAFIGFTSHAGQVGSIVPASISSNNTVGETTYYLDAFTKSLAYEKNGAEKVAANYRSYVRYGHTLALIGFDQTDFNSMPSNIRQMVGILIMALYLLTAFANEFWALILAVLNYANPFYLFGSFDGGGATASALIKTQLTEMDSSAKANLSAFNLGTEVVDAIKSGVDAIRNTIGEYYTLLQNTAFLVVIPLAIACGLFAWLVIRQGRQPGKTFKSLAIRIVFAAVGIPLLLSLYTTALSLVGNFTVSGHSLANDLIKSNFLDFEGWVKTSRLCALPQREYTLIYVVDDETNNDAEIDLVYVNPKGDTSVDTASRYIRTICRFINYAVDHDMRGADFGSGWNSGLAAPPDAKYGINEFSLPSYYSNDLDRTGFSYYDTKMYNAFFEESLKEDAELTYNVLNLLERYAAGDRISASSYENYVKSQMDPSILMFWGSISDTWQKYNWDTYKEYALHTSGAFGVYPNSETTKKDSLKPDANGTMTIEIGSDDLSPISSVVTKHRFAQGSIGGGYSAEGWVYKASDELAKLKGSTEEYNDMFKNGDLMVDADGWMGKTIDHSLRYTVSPNSIYKGYGLSVMSMYNYLSTVFDKTQCTVFSAQKTSDNYAKSEHYSVNIIGSKFLQVIFILDMIALFASFAAVAYGYGFGLLIANFKAMIKMVPAAITGTIGLMRGIASAVILTICMIVELLGTCVIYSLGVNLLGALHDIITGGISAIFFAMTTLGSNLNLDVDGSGTGLAADWPLLIEGAISVIAMIVITGQLLRYRTIICNTVNEMMTKLVNSMLGTTVATPDLDLPASTMNKIGTAALVGAGVASTLPASSNSKGALRSLSDRLGLGKSSGSGSFAEEDSGGFPSTAGKLPDNSTPSNLPEEGNGIDMSQGEYDDSAAQAVVDSNPNFVAGESGATGTSATDASATSESGADESNADSGKVNLSKGAAESGVAGVAANGAKTGTKSAASGSDSADGADETSSDESSTSVAAAETNSTSDSGEDSSGKSAYNGMIDDTNASVGNSTTSSISAEAESVDGFAVTDDNGNSYTISKSADGSYHISRNGVVGDMNSNVTLDGNVTINDKGDIVITGADGQSSSFSIANINDSEQFVDAVATGAVSITSDISGDMKPSDLSLSGIVSATSTTGDVSVDAVDMSAAVGSASGTVISSFAGDGSATPSGDASVVAVPNDFVASAGANVADVAFAAGGNGDAVSGGTVDAGMVAAGGMMATTIASSVGQSAGQSANIMAGGNMGGQSAGGTYNASSGSVNVTVNAPTSSAGAPNTSGGNVRMQSSTVVSGGKVASGNMGGTVITRNTETTVEHTGNVSVNNVSSSADSVKMSSSEFITNSAGSGNVTANVINQGGAVLPAASAGTVKVNESTATVVSVSSTDSETASSQVISTSNDIDLSTTVSISEDLTNSENKSIINKDNASVGQAPSGEGFGAGDLNAFIGSLMGGNENGSEEPSNGNGANGKK